MGLYSKAILLNRKSEGKGLLRKTLEFLENSSQKNKIPQLSLSPYQKNIVDEINQQINLCKINRLPLAIVKISCYSLIHDILSRNKSIHPDLLRENMSAFIETFLAEEAKLISIGNDQYIFTLYNPKSVDPELVVHQLSHVLSYYNHDISNDIIIDFHKKIRIYPDHGSNAEILLDSLI
ncbi:MAG: hypothetical protein JXB88_26935 [Spirochaetales bacterium]|nr:hypothetical protein [Spirochaetales bacterium]